MQICEILHLKKAITFKWCGSVYNNNNSYLYSALTIDKKVSERHSCLLVLKDFIVLFNEKFAQAVTIHNTGIYEAGKHGIQQNHRDANLWNIKTTKYWVNNHISFQVIETIK